MTLDIVNNRYMEKTPRKHQTKTNQASLKVYSILLIQKKKLKQQLESTKKYKDYSLSLDDVSIINEIERSTKTIRYQLCKELNMKVSQILLLYF